MKLNTEQTREWVKRFPIADLKRLGFIPDSRKLDVVANGLLRFLGVSNPGAWEEYNQKKAVAYRKSTQFTESPEATAVWLHIVEREAEQIEAEEFDKSRFKNVLLEIRKKTVLPVEQCFNEAVELCAHSGVALVKVPELKNTHISGATRWLTQNKAMVALSGRHKTTDHLWYTFFHGAAHILLHAKKAIFLETGDGGDENMEEEEADKYAADLLIPSRES